MAGFLNYRGHEPADVPPVLIERNDEGVRIVVQYPPAARRRARNRFLITAGLAIALLTTGRAPYLWIRVTGGFSFIGVMAAIVMALLWVQAHGTYVLEMDARDFCIERRGLLSTRRRCCGREGIQEVKLATDLGGQAVALVIRSISREVGGRYFEYLDDRFLREIAAALGDQDLKSKNFLAIQQVKRLN